MCDDDDLCEIDTTPDLFDQYMAEAEPVTLVERYGFRVDPTRTNLVQNCRLQINTTFRTEGASYGTG